MAAKALLTRDVAAALEVSDRHARRLSSGELKVDASARAVHLQHNPADLPPDAQVRWARGTNVIPMTPGAGNGQMALALTVPLGPNLSEADRIACESRYKVIEPLLKRDAFPAVWSQGNQSKVKVIDWLAKQHKTKRRTIYNWLAAWSEGGLPALVPKDRSDKGKPKSLNAAALEFLIAAAFPKHGAYGKLTVRDIFRAYGEERIWRAKNAGAKLGDFDRAKYARYSTTDGCLAPIAQLPLASYSTFRNWFERIPEIAKTMAREGDEAFHNTQEIISFRNLTDIQPLDYVVMDHRRLDLFCLVPDRAGTSKSGWLLARPWLTAAIDMRTRKWLAWCIVETPSSDSIATVLKRQFLEYGLPISVYWDNGKDFRCEWLEGRSPRTESRRVDHLETGFRGVMDTLGIRVHHAIVKRARSKIIEPNFGRTADFDRTLPWWCGHQPTARPTERFDKLLHQHERWLAGENVEPAFPTIGEVAAFYDDHLKELNERELAGEGMNKITPTGRGWMCPNEAWEQLIRRVEKRTVPEEVIHLCFAKRRNLTIRQGEVRTTFGAKVWHYRLTSNPLRLMALNGCEVQLAYDPLDLQTAALYHENRLVGLVDCVELRRMGEDAFVEDEKARRRGRRETKDFIAKVHQHVHVPGHAERTARREVTPRMEPARIAVPAALPAAMVETAAAIAEDKALAVAVAVQSVAAAEAVDDEFNFFQ
ncbi:MAG TPA: hypothetical protein VHZ25_17955 [Acidobacteriaceae bacterium]|jgi:transposase InsO family protein|nr:hypothetical protein [Acidobacteriaceae bacterium]